jgi:hypothetical protein
MPAEKIRCAPSPAPSSSPPRRPSDGLYGLGACSTGRPAASVRARRDATQSCSPSQIRDSYTTWTPSSDPAGRRARRSRARGQAPGPSRARETRDSRRAASAERLHVRSLGVLNLRRSGLREQRI